MITTTKTAAVLTVCAVSTLLLAGCAALRDVTGKRITSHADTRAELQTPPTWLPRDATDITSATGTAGGDEAPPVTVVFTSEEGVTAPDCATRPRSSAPTMDLDEAPDAYAAEVVLQCGAWSMTSEETRWVAWTPNTGDAPKASASDQWTPRGDVS